MTVRKAISILLVLYFHSAISFAAEALLFSSSQPVEVQLSTDFNQLISDKYLKTGLPGTLKLGDETLAVEVSTRGNQRLENCQFPPLKIKFSVPPTTGFFKGIGEFKLVTHCNHLNPTRTKNMTSENFNDGAVIQEELIYRAYHELTPYSFKTRLFQINYIDTAGRLDFDKVHSAFAIEDLFNLRLRTNTQKATSMTQLRFNRAQTSIMSLFNNMIGNFDWDIKLQKNVKHVIQGGEIIPIPYDFDWSGIMDFQVSFYDPFLSLQQYFISDYEKMIWGLIVEKHEDLCAIPKNDRDQALQLFLSHEEKIISILNYSHKIKNWLVRAERGDLCH